MNNFEYKETETIVIYFAAPPTSVSIARLFIVEESQKKGDDANICQLNTQV